MAIDKTKAVAMVNRMVVAEVALMRAMSTKRGVTKKIEAEERAAARVLYVNLTGFTPSEDEVTEMVSM